MAVDEEHAAMLADAAKQAMKLAYAPYSGYCVGAALLCSDESVYTGCNIENASFSATNCAERTAIFKAVSSGNLNFEAIAVCGGKGGELDNEIFAPCGICRQVMREFCKNDFTVLLVAKDSIITRTLDELLPLSFGPERIDTSHENV